MAKSGKNSPSVGEWIQGRFEGCLDEVFASVVTGILTTVVGYIAITQWSVLVVSPLFFAGIAFILLLMVAIWWRREFLLSYIVAIISPKKPVPQAAFSVIDGPPIRDPDSFFGRFRQSNEFFRCITGPEVLSISILGVRRSGKTSFLNFVKHPRTLGDQLDLTKYLFVFLDLQNATINTPESFYIKAFRNIHQTLEDSHRKLTIPMRSASPVENLEDAIRALNQRGIRIIFLLDEFDYLITRSGFNPEFFSHLRSLAISGNVGWVTTSYRPLHELLSRMGMSAGSPFFNIFHIPPLYLGPLEEDSSHKLMVRLFEGQEMSLTDVDAKFIRGIAGGLPCYIQVATGIYLKYCKDGQYRDRSSLEQCVSGEFNFGMTPHFQHLWDQLDDLEKRVMLELAGNRSSASRLATTARANGVLTSLKNYGVIEQVGKELKLGSSAFASYIKQRGRTEGKVSI